MQPNGNQKILLLFTSFIEGWAHSRVFIIYTLEALGSGVVRALGLESERLDSKACPEHLVAVCSWANYFTYMCLSFFSYKIGVIVPN